MGTHGGNGSRQSGRGQSLLLWVVVVLVFVVSFQFVAYQQGSISQKSVGSHSESQQAFERMLGKFLLTPKNDTRGSANRDVKQILETLCAAKTTSPVSPVAGQRAEICDLVSDKKRLAALKKEVARLHEIMENATTLMDLKTEERNDPGTENFKEYHYFLSTLTSADNSGPLPGEFDFPSKQSLGRLLCFMGSDGEDENEIKYGFAWKEHLPPNATLIPGLTLVTNNEWNYNNIWHGLTTFAPFASWRERGGCAVPERLLLYHQGRVKDSMMPWLEEIVHAIFGRNVPVTTLKDQLVERGKGANSLACFERALVNRRGVGGDQDTVHKMFENLRCRTRAYCGVVQSGLEGGGDITGSKTASSSSVHVTLVLRNKTRAFKDPVAVENAIRRAILEHGDSHLEVAHSENLTFCEQVALFSRTDVLISAHGAQMTNIIFMAKGSSVMEVNAFGWKELAGQGQYVFNWLSDWIQLNHRGYWHDPDGPPCPFPDEDKANCFSFYKDGKVGHNETHLTEWTTTVLNIFNGVVPPSRAETQGSCSCDQEDREQKVAPWIK